MNEIGKVSFEGKRIFVAMTSLQSRAETPPSLPPSDPVPKALRGVIFQPRHHKCSLSEQQLVYSKRYGIVGWSQPKDPSTYRYAHSVWAKERGTSRSLDRSSLLVYKDELLEHVLQQLPATKHVFRTWFKPLGSCDGLQAVARYRLNITQGPFRNPKPHDFRLVSTHSTHTQTHAHMHTRTHTHAHTNTHTCTHMHTRTHTRTHTHTHTHTRTLKVTL